MAPAVAVLLAGLCLLLMPHRGAAQVVAPPADEEGAPAPAGAQAGERAVARPDGQGSAEAWKRECTTQDLLRGLCDEVGGGAHDKVWRVLAQVSFATPVVQDPSPENDRLLVYYLGGELDLPWLPIHGLFATAFVGVSHEFVRIEGQSNFDWLDPLVGLGYRGNVDLGGRSLIMVHRASLYFPLSRASRSNLYYTSLDWLSAFRLPLVGQLMVGLNARARYYLYRHAEQDSDGIDANFADGGGSNTRAAVQLDALLQQGIFDDPRFGNLMAQASIGYRHQLRYHGVGVPAFTWSLGLSYTPMQYFTVSLSLEQPSFAYNLGYSGLNRGGVIRIVGFDRDETSWNLSLFGRF